jgi:tetratricopeptide (TPR) repeat protein
MEPQQILENAIIRILDKTGETIGAGFVVKDNLAVTCAHVIKNIGNKTGKPIRIEFYLSKQKRIARLLREYWSKENENDIAFLEINNPPKGIVPIPLGSSQNRVGHSFYALGFPTLDDRNAYWAQGKIAGIVGLRNKKRQQVLQLDGEQLKMGLSGAPVWDIDAQIVVGMVNEFIDDENTRTGYATTTDTLKKICSRIDLQIADNGTRNIISLPYMMENYYGDSIRIPDAEKTNPTSLELSSLQRRKTETQVSNIFFTSDISKPGNLKGISLSPLYPIPSKDNVPLQPMYFAPRRKLLSDLVNKLTSITWLAFIDGPGKGKTQVALSVASTRELKNMWWISLKSINDNPRQHIFNQLVRWLIEITGDERWWDSYISGQLELIEIARNISKALGKEGLLVIDDLPDSVSEKNLFEDISLITSVFSETKTKIISTSQRDLPPSVTINLASSFSVTNIPYFTTDDTLDILESANAPIKIKKANIVSLITATGKGHPILIAQTINWLKHRDWNFTVDEITGLLTGEPVKDTLDFTRRELLRIIDISPKELVYRLSLLWESFDRKLALEIANIGPKINNPGECVDELAGVYLDRLSNGKFSIAPLLAKAGEENLPEEIQREIHNIVANHYLSSRTLNISDGQNVLLHLWAAKEYEKFGMTLIQLLVSVKKKEHAKQLKWATGFIFGINWPDEIDLNMRIMIRSVQVRVSVLAGDNYLGLNNDLDHLLAESGPENAPALIFAYGIAGVMCRELPLFIALPRYIKLYQLLQSNKQLFEEQFPPELIDGMPDMVWSLSMTVNNSDEINYFLRQLLSLTEIDIQILFNSSISIEASSYMLDKSWESEASKPEEQRDWTKVLSFINEIEAIAFSDYLLPIKIACARAKAIIYSEYIEQSEVALATINSYSTLDNLELSFLVNYTAGNISYNMRRFDDAIVYFEKTEQVLGKSFVFYRIDAKRKLTILMSRKGRWDIAKSLCVQVIHQIRKDYPNLRFDELEMMGELAWIHWSTGNRKKACAALYGYSEGLINNRNESDSRFHEAFNKLGHALGWFALVSSTGQPPTITGDGGSYTPVQSGFFGERREKLGDHIPKLGFSFGILFSQLSLLASSVGVHRLAWVILQKTIVQFVKEGKQNDLLLGAIYPELTLLEDRFGDSNKAVEYFNQSVEYWAISGKLQNIPKHPSEVRFIDIKSLLENNIEKDYKLAGRQALYLIFLPMFINWVTNDIPISNIEYLKNFWLRSMGPDILSTNNWAEIFEQVYRLILTWISKGNLDELELHQVEVPIEILSRLLKSVSPRHSLQESLELQLSLVVFLIENRQISNLISHGVDSFIYKYWEKVSKTQRFALRNPDLFKEELGKIHPDLGIITLVSIIKCVNRALGSTLSQNVLAKLNLIDHPATQQVL